MTCLLGSWASRSPNRKLEPENYAAAGQNVVAMQALLGAGHRDSKGDGVVEVGISAHEITHFTTDIQMGNSRSELRSTGVGNRAFISGAAGQRVVGQTCAHRDERRYRRRRQQL